MDKKGDKMVFDIKGSTANRYVNLAAQRFSRKNFNQKSVLKDMNFTKINQAMDYRLIQLNASDHAHLKDIIDKDTKFLLRKGLMDYSLLVGIEVAQIDRQGTEQVYIDYLDSAECSASVNTSQKRHTYMMTSTLTENRYSK